jgi:single-strand DNA-binding protein
MLRLQVIGHLGSDATITQTSGKAVVNFSVAHTEKFKDRNEVQQERTTWVECAMWGGDKVAPYLKKGTQVFIEGSPAVNVYLNKDQAAQGNLKVTVLDLQLLGSKNGNNG